MTTTTAPRSGNYAPTCGGSSANLSTATTATTSTWAKVPSVNFDCVFLDLAPIRIGCGTLIGPKVQLLTAHHPFDAATRGTALEAGKPIVIGDHCWLGGGVIVCPGVTIGDRAVIGAGSVVTRDIPADSVAAGNPARIIRTL